MENEKAVQVASPLRCDVKPTVENFITALNAGSDNWVMAGEILVTLRNEDEFVFNKLCHDYPFVTPDILETFYQIGLHTLNPMALLLPRHAFNAVRQMKVNHQDVVMCNPIEIVSRMAGDKPVVVRKGIAKLSPDECRRALSKKGPVPVERQIKNMMALTPKPLPQIPRASVQVRTPVEVARFAARRGVGGSWVFEKTMARNCTEQRVLLHTGQAVIVLTEYKD